MLKKTGNKTEGYTITHVISKGAKKINKTLSTKEENTAVDMEFTAATTLSKNAIYATFKGVEILIVDDEESGLCRLFGNVLHIKDKTSRKSWYIGFELNTVRPIILESNAGESYKSQDVTVHGGKYIITNDIILWQEGDTFKNVIINVKRSKLINDILVIRGSFNNMYGTWIVDAADRLLYTTFSLDKIEFIERVGCTFAVKENGTNYVLSCTRNGNDIAVDTVPIVYTENLHKRTYNVMGATAFEAITFSNNLVGYVLVNYAKLVQAGVTFRLAENFFTFDEKTLDLIKIDSVMATQLNTEMVNKYNLELEKDSISIVKGELPEDSKLYRGDRLAGKGHILSKSVFEIAEDIMSDEMIDAVAILRGDVCKKISFSTQCSDKATSVQVTSSTDFCTKGNTIIEQASGIRRFGNYLVLTDFLSSASVIITLDKVNFVRGSNLKFVLPTDNFDLGVLGNVFSLELSNCKVIGDYIKFTTKGIAVFDRTLNKGILIAYDGTSLMPLDVKDFADLNYYALFDTEDWERYYYVSLPIKDFVHISDMNVF